jgi:hypothetical protein
MIITVWQQYETARSTVDQEANDLATIYTLANRLPESERRQVQQVACSYAQTVIDEEWPMLQEGQLSSYAGELLNEIRQDIENFEPNTYGEQVLYDQAVSQVNSLADTRRLRLHTHHLMGNLVDWRSGHGILCLSIWVGEYSDAHADGWSAVISYHFDPLCNLLAR